MLRRFTSRLQLKHGIGLGAVAVLVVMATVTWFSMTTLDSAIKSTSELLETSDAKKAHVQTMRELVRMRSADANNLWLTDDLMNREFLLEEIEKRTRLYHSERTAFDKLPVNDNEQRLLEAISDADNHAGIAQDTMRELVETDWVDAALIDAAIQNLQRREFILVEHLSALLKLEQQLGNDLLMANRHEYERTQRIIAIVVVSAFALSCLIAAAVIVRVIRSNARIAYLASHDDLTGLINRRAFEEALGSKLDSAQRYDVSFGLMYFDLDHFKIINDTCGHHAGDELLRKITRLINGRLRSGDMFARVGGDEFAIIAQGNSFDEITSLAEDLRQRVADFVFLHENQEFKVSLSIGLVPLDGTIKEISRILNNADSACYVAKRGGRNRVHVASANDVDLERYRDDIASAQFIRQAMADNRLTLHFQPIYALQNEMRIDQCEILLRLDTADGSFIEPDQFLPAAAQYGLSVDIDRWVVWHTTNWLAHNDHGSDTPRLLVKLAEESLRDAAFLDFVIDTLRNRAIDASRIVFELAEVCTVDKDPQARAFVDGVLSVGCGLSIQKFGLGSSAICGLKGLDIDFLKIDGDRVRGIVDDGIDREFVKAIDAIGRAAGLNVIAEGVETRSGVDKLIEMGIKYAQGFALQQPAPLSSLPEVLPQIDPAYRRAG